MHRVVLAAPDDVEGFIAAAGRLAASGVAPAEVSWRVIGAAEDLFAAAATPPPACAPVDPRVDLPVDFCELARWALRHRDPERFALLYALLVRLRQEPRLLDNRADAMNARAQALAKAVGRDRHKMTAFVRFREVETGEAGPVFVAWFEPEHHILRLTAGFFVRRFASQRFSILTPEASAHWDGEALRFGPGAARRDAPDGDRLEALWLTYYAHIFNPARLKVAMMKSEMPVKYWRNLPEAALIQPLIRAAATRSAEMIAKPRAPDKKPRAPGRQPAQPLPSDQPAAALAACVACDLYASATQAVPGEGPRDAALMIVGEQPGDQEDLAGRPFVGPAGRLLDEALRRVGLERRALYVTHAVKHFRFEPRGKQRLHKAPAAEHLRACAPWLAVEIDQVRPQVIVALGKTAAASLLGEGRRLGELRGAAHEIAAGRRVVASWHPAALLRLTTAEDKRRAWREFLEDLRLAARLVAEG